METEELSAYRNEFPLCERFVYLDHAGIAPVSGRVIRAVAEFLQESAEGAAFFYPQWEERVRNVRKVCARLINADHEEVAFVRSTSHGLSLVASGLDWRQGDNVLYYEREFPSNIYPWLMLAERGVEARAVPTREGGVRIEDIESRMDSRTRLVSISSVQFTNGFRADLDGIGKLCRSRGVLLCLDAIQSMGLLPLDVRSHPVDFLAADAHKWLLGPEGIGLFFCRRDLAERLRPPLVGWKSVRRELEFERPELHLKSTAQRFEEGSMNLMGIFGLGAAVELLLEVGVDRIQQRVLDLGEILMKEADRRGLAVLTPRLRQERGGSVTIGGLMDPNLVRDVLRKQGTMVNVRGGGIRVSPHFYNTPEELERLFRQMDLILGN